MKIVGYTYNAETLCLGCMWNTALLTMPDRRPVPSYSVEVELDEWARQIGIDRYDEHTYDSGDFPKVIFATQVEDEEKCDTCGEGL